MKDLELSFEILKKIYIEQAYASLELSKRLKEAENPKFVTSLVYGVLEKDTELEYYISKLVTKKPRNVVVIILKMGMYIIKYFDSVPTYAAVNETVELCNTVGKKEIKGFVNAVLKKFSTTKFKMPSDDVTLMSIKTSTPIFVTRKIINQYGLDKAEAILTKSKFDYEHIRINKKKTTLKEIEDKIKDFIPSTENSIYAKNDKTVKDLYSEGLITIQSLSSMKCCETLAPKDGDKILDLCSAPGGKSMYMAELANVSIVSCDIHDHRLKLIQSYANRMGIDCIEIKKNDAEKENKDFINMFDKVLCDVPCSGLGVALKKPDIYLNMCENDIISLSKVQARILDTASKYVKKGGFIVYSTCTILKEENQDVVENFLKKHKNFKSIEEIQLLPDGKGQDGFYIHKLKRL